MRIGGVNYSGWALVGLVFEFIADEAGDISRWAWRKAQR